MTCIMQEENEKFNQNRCRKTSEELTAFKKQDTSWTASKRNLQKEGDVCRQ
jgi:hypothetical protein